MSGRVLVAGIGNIFLGDDGFGAEVASALAPARCPTACRIDDFGIRGVHLAYELLDGYEALVLVDAMSTRGAARHRRHGRARCVEPRSTTPVFDAHSRARWSCSTWWRA